ncbi:hypothetical protein H9P43_001721 [Blastocladiella emersonii ATCC 22665]|nr:hypothetical protein H9P43_001721 [Blastocladiella emersonii ATCC 22665]
MESNESMNALANASTPLRPTATDGNAAESTAIAPLGSRSWFHGSRDMLTEFGLGPVYDEFFRPYMKPAGSSIHVAPPQMDTSCDGLLDFMEIKPARETLTNAQGLIQLMIPDLNRSTPKGYNVTEESETMTASALPVDSDQPSGSVASGATMKTTVPSAMSHLNIANLTYRELGAIQPISAERFERAFSSIRPGRLYNFSEKDELAVGYKPAPAPPVEPVDHDALPLDFLDVGVHEPDPSELDSGAGLNYARKRSPDADEPTSNKRFRGLGSGY